MAKKHNDGYLSAKESRRISKENRKITNALEKKRKRKNVPESEYLTVMHDPNNAVEFDNLHTYFSPTPALLRRLIESRSPSPTAKMKAVLAISEAAKRTRFFRPRNLKKIPKDRMLKGQFLRHISDSPTPYQKPHTASCCT